MVKDSPLLSFLKLYLILGCGDNCSMLSNILVFLSVVLPPPTWLVLGLVFKVWSTSGIFGYISSCLESFMKSYCFPGVSGGKLKYGFWVDIYYFWSEGCCANIFANDFLVSVLLIFSMEDMGLSFFKFYIGDCLDSNNPWDPLLSELAIYF